METPSRSTVPLSLRRRAIACVAVMATLGLILIGIISAQAGHAADSMQMLFHKKTTGTISITGNTLSTCSPTARNCPEALNLTGPSAGNNFFKAVRVDVDDDPQTQTSSSAHVTVPDGGKVLAAYLFWSATQTRATDPKTIKFRAPGGSYQTLSPSPRASTLSGGNYRPFSTFADVTDIVRTAGSGDYWGADVSATYDLTDRYAGWALVVVIEDETMPMRDLAVFETASKISETTPVEASINGFVTPKTGPVQAKIGTVAWEGDKHMGGDWVELDGKRVADALSESNNFFVGVVSNNGVNLTDRNPNNPDTLAVDAKIVDATGLLENQQSSATVKLGSKGDVFYLSAVTTQIDLYVPDITPEKSVVNISSAQRGDAADAPAKVGDILEYTVAMVNKGQDTATETVFSDPLPDHTTYVPGSLKTIAGATTTELTDASGDDAGEFADNTVTVRLGTNATASAGGNMPYNGAQTVKFRVKLAEDSAGQTITNRAKVTYTGDTDGESSTRGSNALATPVSEAADVSVTKTGPRRVDAGRGIEWELNVHNAGPGPATDTVVRDTLPADITNPRIVSPSEGCSLSEGSVTCRLGDVPVGDTQVIRIAADIDPALADPVTSVVNEASVSTSTSDPDPGNNRSSAVTAIDRHADVAVTKKVTDNPNPVPGESVTFEVTVANNGPSQAKDVSVSDPLPEGLVAVGTPTTTLGSCSASEDTIACGLGDLAAGEKATITITARVVATWTDSSDIVNTAVAQSSRTPDPDTSNNSASATVKPKAPQADIVVTKTMDSAEMVPGRQVTYSVQLTNKGPSRARDITLTDRLPAGLHVNSVSSATDGCAAEGDVVTCRYDVLAVGSRSGR
ncbi:DUF11 domain-containing protein [Nanchangia anserum]|uniref:isopeptide-forming domain-containing fimbrial protein n=1 Tax=Nanchangia anserum TaxID=2692125 RepID=UPI0018844FB1|nr:isopeptide-forming domain-containing fimbrial protein [Nanchangia anserum]QOX81511.1 DUF11 domain-containing protein [Nanchangia anserum]